MDAIFWGLLGTTGLLGLGIVWRAVRRPREIPQLPLVAAAMWLYFYGFMAYAAARGLRAFLPDWTLALGQATALLGFGALVAGWVLAVRERREAARTPPAATRYNWPALWWIGVGLILASGMVHYSLVRQPDPDWQSMSAYVYLFFHVGYPGMALCVVARVKGGFKQPLERLAFVGVVAFAMLPHLMNARRGPLFPLIMVVVFLPAILRRSPPSRLKLFGALGGAGVLMLLFVAVRPWVYSSGASSVSTESWAEAVTSLTLEQVLVERSTKVSDNEYVYHCGTIATNVELGSYQYGTGYLSLLTHWIPRRLWPAKPGLGEGWYGSNLDRVPLVMGWRMTPGASAGGVSEVFNQLGWASPLFWLWIGWCAGTLYRHATVVDDPRWAVAYIGILCASHWLVSQGFAAAFVPGAVYQVVPAVVFLFARKGRRGSRIVWRSHGATR